jgi:hypothetical protein
MMEGRVDNRTVINFDPTLFLFLGTTPGKVGWRLKKMFYQTYGDIPVLKFLWIDIDQNMDQEGRSWFNRSEERVELSGFDPAQISRNLGNFPFIESWWPEASPPPGRLSGGGGSPKQMRLVGRMGFFAKFNDNRNPPSLYTRLETTLNQLKQINVHRETEAIEHDKYRFQINQNNVSVFLIYSPCGGTGSSIAFDLAYLCRHILEGSQPRIISFSLSPSVFLQVIKPSAVAQRKKLQANTYAWFKEHNHLLENPNWNVTYSDGVETDLLHSPFDYQYLVGIENQGGYRLSSLDDVASMMAQALFLSSGTNTAQSLQSFAANVHRLGHRFDDKLCAYSSFSAASLIFPKDRLQRYCASKHSSRAIKEGFLASVDESVIKRSASTTLSRNGLLDREIVMSTMDVGRVQYTLEQSLKNAEDVGTAMSIINNQDAECQRILSDKEKKLVENHNRLLKQKTMLIIEETLMVIRQYGLLAAIDYIDKLLDTAQLNQTGASIYSLNQVKANVHQHGVTENDLKREKSEFELSKKDVAKLDDGPEDKLERMINMRGWLKKFKSYKESVIKQMKDVHETQLQFSAQRHALKLIDELVVFLQSLSKQLSTSKIEIDKRITGIENQVDSLLIPTKHDLATYEFLREVEIDFEDYYQQYSKTINDINDFSFIPPHVHSIGEFESWVKDDFEVDMLKFSGSLFEEELVNTSLLSIIRKTAERKGRNPKDFLQEQLDAITNYCLPFYKYNANIGMPDPELIQIIGVEDKTDPILPISDDDARFSVETTGIKDRIDIAVFQFGLPAHMLDEITPCQRMYLSMLKPSSTGKLPDDPLHVLPGIDLYSEDFVPEKDEEKRELFVLAIAFNYIIQKGQVYYVDPGKTYQEHNTTPPNEYKLDRGRERASQAFIQKPDLISLVDLSIQKEISNMGNAAAIEYLDDFIQKHYERIASYSSSADQTLRKVLEKEIKAVQKYQRTLRI